MLPAVARVRRSADFRRVLRQGRRVARPLLTVHLLVPAVSIVDTARVDAAVPRTGARAGLVVNKAVGGSVVRSRTARRLRHLLRDRLPGLPVGADLVVRAAPAAGTASSAALGRDLDAALLEAGRPRRAQARQTPRTAQR